MANLLFQPADLLNELVALQGLAGRFLDSASPYSLEQLADEIQSLKTRGGRHTIEIPEGRPLKTRVSEGEFEPPNKTKSTRRVFGSITGIWEVEASKVAIHDPDRPNKKPKPTMLIGFTGKASTVFVVQDEETRETVACWKMELGDADSPGCFFHTFASADRGFPVPRHPNMFATPMASIGFALGELFQAGWLEAVSGTGDAPNRWRSIQAKRFAAMLRWQLGEVAKTTSSPWCTLKAAKPEKDLFLRKLDGPAGSVLVGGGSGSRGPATPKHG